MKASRQEKVASCMVLEEAESYGVACEDLDLSPLEGVLDSDHKVVMVSALVVLEFLLWAVD